MSYEQALEHHVQRRLHVELDVPSPVADPDGDYCWVSPKGPTVYLRPLGEPPVLRVWTVAATGVKGNAPVLRELNSWNTVTCIARAVWRAGDGGGHVVVAADAELETVAPGQLGRLAQHVAATAVGVGESLALAAGAHLPWTDGSLEGHLERP